MEKSPVVEILQFIFNLTLTEPNQWYKLSSASEYILETVVPELHYLGLITLKKPGDTIKEGRFCINSLMQSFLLSQKGSNEQMVSMQQTQPTDQGFIIVESNFKLYAYTDSPLYRAILRLFMKEEYRFSNLIVGMLTRESLNEAFKKHITAKQIMDFI